MLLKHWLQVSSASLLMVTLTSVTPLTAAAQDAASHDKHGSSPTVTVFATGLNNPRGLHFGPDGRLYVAEAGTGGSQSTVGQCAQVAAPIGPYTGSPTGSDIVAFDEKGDRTVVASGFPSSQTADSAGRFISGVADMAWIGHTMYVVTSGSGCSHGVPGTNNIIARINKDGTFTEVANLSAFQQANPTKVTEDDFEPDGTWYSLLAGRGSLFAVEPNHGELDQIRHNGKISRIVDISASQGHIVPTAMALHNGAFYVGNLGEFPAQPKSKIMRIDMQGNISTVAEGLTTVLGVAFDERGRLYALQTSAPATDPKGPPVVPGTGSVVRLDEDGKWETIASGLTFPTAMTFGPDGDLYVSNFGFVFPNFPAGSGQIVKIHVGEERH